MKSSGGAEPCPVCGSSVYGWLPGLRKCRACGLVFRAGKYFGGPEYSGEQWDAVCVSAKAVLFASALDYIGSALAGPGSLRVMLEKAGFREIRLRNSPPTAGDPYRSGGRLGGVLTGGLKVLYYWLAQALRAVSFGRVLAGSALIVTARK